MAEISAVKVKWLHLADDLVFRQVWQMNNMKKNEAVRTKMFITPIHGNKSYHASPYGKNNW